MAVKYLSNKFKDLQVGITNYSENKGSSLYVVGNVGVGTNDATAEVGISNTSILAVGILTAYRIYSSVYGEFTGAFSGGTVDTDSLNVTGISTLGTVKVSGGIVTATAGVVTYYGDGQYLTGVAATERVDTRSLNVSGISTFNEDIQFKGANTNALWDHSTSDLILYNNTRLEFGDNKDFEIWHGGSHTFLKNSETGGDLRIRGDKILLKRSDDQGKYIECTKNQDVKLFYNEIEKFATTLQGVQVSGTTSTTELGVSGVSTFTGNIDANGTLDVDGQTSLDDLVVTGVATFNNTVTLASLLDCNGGADIDTLTAATAKISDLTQNRIVIAGASGELADNANLTYTSSTLNVGTDLNVVGSTTSAHLTVTGFSTFTGPIDCDSGADISGSALNVSSGLVANSAQISDLTDNRIVIVGNSGELEDSSDLTFDGSTFAVTGDATFSGNVSIAGTLTKEDVTNVDSIGLITARSGVRITGGGLNVSGVSTFAGNIDANGDLDVDGHTELDNLNVSGLSTFGGQLKIDGDILVDTPHVLQFGHSSQQAYIYHTSSNLMVTNIVGDVYITTSDDDKDIKIQTDNGSGGLANYFLADGSTGEAILYHYGTERIKTSSSGAIVTGVLTATSFSGDGSQLTNVGGTGLWIPNSAGIHTTVDVGIGTTNPSLPVTIGNTAKLSVGIVSTYNLYAKDVNVSGDSTLTGDTFVGSAITMYASTGIVSATSFYGEGSNLTDVSWGSTPGSSSFITQGSQTAVGGDAGDWQVIAGYWAGCCANTNTRNNVIFGKSAGRKLVDGDRNVLIGDEVGCGLTTGMRNIFMGADVAKESTTGDYNIGLGYKTLRTSTGSCNIAIGFCAADGNTSGTNNVIIGKNANSDVGVGGTDNVWIGTDSGGYASGCCNTFVGAQSGYGVYNGTFNVGLGYQAGKSVIQQTAHYNVSIGAKAGLLGTTGSCNVFLGLCAGRAVSTGDFNLFAGHKAGDAVTVGACNVYLGNLAGAGSTAGERNIAVGQCAGYSNKTGSYNISFGSCAGYTNETGVNNVFIGKDAGKISTDSNNTFIGSSSGSKVTSGDSNVFLGTNSGLEATTAGCNIFIGANAGQGDSGQPIIGGCNIALGAFSGNELKDGTDNLFLGTRAGKITDDGISNVFLGYYAGSANGSGNCNVFIGNRAGDTNTTGNKNIAIGYNVELPNASTSCQFAIGNGTDRWIAGDSNFNTTLAGIVTAYASGIVSATSYYGDGSNLTNVGGGSLIEGITVKEEGSTVGVAGSIKTLDFLGGTVTATASGTTATITIAGAGTTDGWTQDSQGNLVAGDGAGASRDADTCTNIMIGCNVGNSLNAGCYNTFLGCGAGQFATGGHSNVAIGCSAGQNLSASAAFHQVFIGSGAGMNATCINSRMGVAIGYKAGCTQVCYDVFIGCGAGRSNETGSHNIILGLEAGSTVTDGCCNTIIGTFAGRCLTTGNQNIFLGEQAGQCVTSSCRNIFIGEHAGYNTQNTAVGTDNVVLGNGAAVCLGVNAQRNIMIGPGAGEYLKSGCCNIAIGPYAGQNNDGGIHNTFLGAYAGASNTSGGCNVAIGKFVCLPSATGSNQFAIGCCKSHWITGDANFNVGIGTNTTDAVGVGVTAKLSVGIVSAYKLYSKDVNVSGIATFASVDINNGAIDGTNIGVFHRSNANFNYVDIANDLDVTGNTELKGNVDLGNSGTDTITPNGRFDANIMPHIDNNQNYKLGSSGYRWHTAHFGTGGINIDGGGITAVGIITATSFSGDGSDLVGVAKSTVLEDAGINPTGISTFLHLNITGISTFGSNILVTGTASAADFNSTSDIRLKTNIKRIEDPLSKVIRIEGVTFDWKEWNRPALGVIADQVQEVIPELVQGTDPKTVNYNGLIGLLIEAVKEQQTQIDDLKSRLSKLE